MTAKRSKRILVTIKPEHYDEVQKFADSHGVSMSMIVNLSFQSGFVALKLASDPEFQKFMIGKDEEEVDLLVKKVAREGKKAKKDG